MQLLKLNLHFTFLLISASVLSTGNVDRIALPLCWNLIGAIRFDSVYLSAQSFSSIYRNVVFQPFSGGSITESKIKILLNSADF